jgi:hypothetical protein
MAILSKLKKTKPQMDLSGPEGNVFVLIGTGLGLGKELGWNEEELDTFKDEMMSSDYTHAVETFDLNFGRYIDLIMADPKAHKNEVIEKSANKILDELLPETTLDTMNTI